MAKKVKNDPAEASVNYFEQLNLSEDDLESLGKELLAMVEDLEASHREYFDDIARWWQLYEAEPEQKRRSMPWDGASNIVIPTARIASDTIVSRVFGQIYAGGKIWVGRSRNTEFADKYLPHVVDFLNYVGTKEFDIYTPTLDWLNEAVPVGQSVLGLRWVDEKRHVIVPGTKKPQLIRLRRGAKIEHIPRESILWEFGKTINESMIVVREHNLTKNEFIRQANDNGWREDAVESALKAPGINGVQRTVRDKKDKIDGVAAGGRIEASNVYDIRECWVDWPLIQSIVGKKKVVGPLEDNERIRVPLVVTIHRLSGQVLQVIPKPYLIPGWPFYDVTFRKRSGRNTAAGICHLTEHMQRGMTAMLNQAIDAVTFSNSLKLITSSRSVAESHFEPNKPMYVSESDLKGSILPLNLPSASFPDFNLITMLQTTAERVTGMSDPLLGRETRSGGHPSPATSTLALMEEGNKTMGTFLKHVRKVLSQVGTDVATLYQQFEAQLEPNGEMARISAVMGMQDAAKVMQWIFPVDQPIFGNLELDLYALDEIHNPEAERNKAVMVDQMVSNYWARVSQMISVTENPQAPPLVKEVMLQGIVAASESLKEFLENSDIDDPERFMLVMQRQSNEQLFSLEQLAGTVRQQMQMQQQQQQQQAAEAQQLSNRGAAALGQGQGQQAQPAPPAGLF